MRPKRAELPWAEVAGRAQAAGSSDWPAADEAALDYPAIRIAPKFGVAAEVIAKRLRVEKHWPPS